MAVLIIVQENRKLTSVEEIRQYLAPAGIEYDRWELVPEIDKNSTSEAIVDVYADRIERVKQQGGFAKADVINVNSSTPGLEAMLAKFSTEHWHNEEEVRFIVSGRGVYHVHMPDNDSVTKLEVEAGDMIRVPRGTLHWFDLCADREIKAIRFFQDMAGWTPHYTHTGLEKQYEPICFGPTYVPTAKVFDISWPISK